MEKKTITRWFWVWQFEKEEEWLNEMAANGWVLESVGFCRYTFVRCEPGEYTVRTEIHIISQIWEAYESVIALWRRTGLYIAERCGFEYPGRTEQEMTAFIHSLREQ